MLRHCGCHQHAGTHRLAMQPDAVTSGRLNRMAEGMTEVQQRAIALFALVPADDLRFDLTGAANGVGQCIPTAGQQPINIHLQPMKKAAS